MSIRILAINPGSTSTKIALFEDNKELFSENIKMKEEDYKKHKTFREQFEHRLSLVIKSLEEKGYNIKDLSCVVGRGGIFPPIHTKGYIVNDVMKDLIFSETLSPHASNFGAILAAAIAEPIGVPAYIYDATSANEFIDIAKITGFPEVVRESTCHVLNTRAIGHEYAESLGKKYEEMNLLIAHLGGGITVSAHFKGRMIDSVADDGGPFSPERSGSIRMLDIINLCFGGKVSEEHIRSRVRGNGGLKAYLNTSDGVEIEKMVKSGDELATKVFSAQAYQVAKAIGLTSVVFKGDLDAVIITGGLAYSDILTEDIKSYVGFLAPFVVMPGEREMEALAYGGYRILTGKEKTRELRLVGGKYEF